MTNSYEIMPNNDKRLKTLTSWNEMKSSLNNGPKAILPSNEPEDEHDVVSGALSNAASTLILARTFSNPKATKLEKAIAASSLVSTVYQAGKKAYDRRNHKPRRNLYVLKFSESSWLYKELEKIINTFEETSPPFEMTVDIQEKYSSDIDDYVATLTPRTAEKCEVRTVIADQDVTIILGIKNDTSARLDVGYVSSVVEGQAIFESHESRSAFVKHFNTLASLKEKTPEIYLSRGNGNWKNHDGIKNRSLDTVILKSGVKEMIVEDLRRFLSEESKYVDLGIPYHRGYLLSSPPGTGKTSLATALATEFQLDTHIISLSSVKNDDEMNYLVSSIGSRSLLVLEDIDIATATKKRDDEKGGLTLSGLLNVLDGIMTPHGLITIMSTNNRDALDSALIRPGRVDLDIQLDYIDDDQLRRMCQQFLKTTFDLPPISAQVTPAQVVGIFKETLGLHGIDNEIVHQKLKELITA